MNFKVSGYKQLFLVITALLCLIVIIIISVISSPENQSLNTTVTVILSLVILLLVFFVPDKYYMRYVFNHYNEENVPDYFMIYAAKIISLDNHFSKAERKKVIKYMNNNYGIEYTKIKIINLELIISEIDSIFPRFKYPNRYTRLDKLRLLQNIIGLAVTDRFLSKKELEFINQTADIFGCTENDLKVIFNMYNYVTEEESEYQRVLKTKPNYSLVKSFSALGLDSSATFEEAKEAYRSLVKVFHPEKLGKGYKDKEGAKNKFQVIQEAYDRIKKEKG